MMRRNGYPALVALVAAGGVAITGCRNEDGDDGAAPVSTTSSEVQIPTESSIEHPGVNVLLVSVDTTRADHLGCYGHPVVKTPNIDRLAAEGVQFNACISSAPLTLPSHTSMLTGSYPFVHGARDNGLFSIAEENVTLAEIFADAGYTTHAQVAAAVLNRHFGVAQGFETFEDVATIPHSLLDEDLVNEPIDGQIDLEREGFSAESERHADEISDRGIIRLQQAAADERPFFIFLHYFDPHWPHEAPERFASQYEDGYYAEIAYFDEQFGRVLDELDRLGLSDDTMVVLTSDHGEGRGEHGELTHSTLVYDSTLHVPLIMRCPGDLPAGTVIEGQVRLIDIAPTLVALAALETTGQMQGTTLLPFIEDPDRMVRLPCYADTFVPRHTYNYSPLRALRDDSWKYIHAPVPELYDLQADARELFNTAEGDPEQVDVMRQEMRDIIANSPSPPGGRGTFRSFDDPEVQQIASLGYVGAAWMEESMLDVDELEDFEPTGVNPRDRIEAINLWAQSVGTFHSRMFEDAETHLRRFLELEPESPGGASYLGRTLALNGKYEESVEWFYRAAELRQGISDLVMAGQAAINGFDYDEGERAFLKALELEPDDAEARTFLARVRAAQGRYDEALADYELALETTEEPNEVLIQRGITLRFADRDDEALASFEQVLENEPLHVRANEQIAMIDRANGRTDQAIQRLQAMIAAGVDAALIHQRLGNYLTETGQLEEAGRHFEAVLVSNPESGIAHHNLAENLLRRGKAAEAVPRARKAVELTPAMSKASHLLAVALEQSGDPSQASVVYEQLIETTPAYAPAYSPAANLLVQRGDVAAAIDLLRRGHEAAPKNVNIMNDLAWHLATRPEDELRDGAEALALAEEAATLTGAERFNEVDTLAAAYAEVGRFDEAVEAAQRGVDLARTVGFDAVADRIQMRLELYQAGKPYRAE